MLERLGAAVREVRLPAQLEDLEGLVIPGGESTTMAKLMTDYGLLEAIRAFGHAGHPIYGSCAGLIALARDTLEGGQPTLGLMDIVARRNAFGRQLHSFETDLELDIPPGGPSTPSSSAHRGSRRRVPRARAGPPRGPHRGGRGGPPHGHRLPPRAHGDTRVHAYFLEKVRQSRVSPPSGSGARRGVGRAQGGTHKQRASRLDGAGGLAQGHSRHSPSIKVG